MLLLNDVCGVEYIIFELTKKKKKQLTWFIDFPCSFCKYSYATFNLEAKHEQHKKFKRKLNLKGMNLTIRPKLLQYISHLQSNVRESTKKRVFLFFVCITNMNWPVLLTQLLYVCRQQFQHFVLQLCVQVISEWVFLSLKCQKLSLFATILSWGFRCPSPDAVSTQFGLQRGGKSILSQQGGKLLELIWNCKRQWKLHSTKARKI